MVDIIYYRVISDINVSYQFLTLLVNLSSLLSIIKLCMSRVADIALINVSLSLMI